MLGQRVAAVPLHNVRAGVLHVPFERDPGRLEDAAIFEPTHGSAPKYAGLNKVNPMAMMLSGMLMLRRLDEIEAAERLESAIAEVIREGASVTYDMKPSRDDPTAVGTSEVADAIIDEMGARV